MMNLDERMEAIGLPIYPDTLVLGQFGYLRKRDRNSPERDMFAALLEDALRCWLGKIGVSIGYGSIESRSSRLHCEANRWIYGDGKCTVSFKTVCELLELDPEWIRAKLPTIDPSGLRHQGQQRGWSRHRVEVSPR